MKPHACCEPASPVFPFGDKAQVHARNSPFTPPALFEPLLTVCALSFDSVNTPNPIWVYPSLLAALSHFTQPNQRFLSFCMRNHLVAGPHPYQALRLTWSTFPTWLGGHSVPLLVKAEYKCRVEAP